MKRLLLLAGLSATLLGCGQKSQPSTETAATPPAVQTEASAPATPAEAPSQQPAATPTPADSAPAVVDNSPPRPIPSRWQEGTHYTAILPAQNTGAEPGQVEILEFLWLGCPHCYELNPYIEAWKKKLPSYVKFTQMHITWDAVKIAHAKLFYAIETLGGDALVVKAFDEIHRRNNFLVGNSDASTLQMQQAFAATNGLDVNAFLREYNGFSMNTKLQRSNQLMRAYRIDSVPAFIVNGKYRTDVGRAGGSNELTQLLSDLAASEKR